MTGYETFALYNSLKLHFTKDSFDFFKYGGKSRISVNAFENRKDKWFFYKISLFKFLTCFTFVGKCMIKNIENMK